MRKTLITLALLSVLQLCAFTAFENGKWSADIITPDNPNHAEAFAANELQYHFGKMTGVKPAIIKESQKSALPYHFYIGNTAAARAAGIDKSKFAMDHHQIKNVKDGVIFTGGDRNGNRVGHQWSAACQGTLYAVYDYLEKDLGVKWIFPGELGEIIPARKKLEVGKLDRSGKEPLVARRMRETGQKAPYGWSSKASRDKFIAAQGLFLIRHRMGATVNLYQGHAFAHYWREYGKTHPEYFSLLPNGKREPLKGDPVGEYITMCVSNPGLHQLIVKKWKSSINRTNKNNPPLINLCENDTPGMCTCAKCRSWDADDPRFAASDYWGKGKDPLTRSGRFQRLSFVQWGEDGDKVVKVNDPPHVSDRYAKFYMAVLAEAKKVNPNARVIAYAYANYTEAPKNTRLSEDVILNFVPSGGFPYGEKQTQSLKEKVEGWRAAGIRQFVLRPNYMLMGWNMPVNLGRIITRDFTYAASQGMIGTNFDSLTGAWANQGMMLYSLIRSHRQPDFGYENALREYTSAFAPADKEITAYLNFWEKFCTTISQQKYDKIRASNVDNRGNIGGGHANFFIVTADLYPTELFVEANKLLDAASRRAAGNELVLKRIDYLRKGLRDAELTRDCRAAHKVWQLAKAANKPRAERVKLRNDFTKAFRKLVAFRKSAEADFICNFGHFAVYERFCGGWEHARVK